MNNKLFVGNLSWNVTSEQLADFFAALGKIVEAVVVRDRMTGRSKGFGFVTFETEAEANAAVDQLNGKELDGRAINVSLAKPREERE